MERSFHFGLSDVRSVLTRLLRPIYFAAGISGPEQRSTETSSGGGESVRGLPSQFERPRLRPRRYSSDWLFEQQTPERRNRQTSFSSSGIMETASRKGACHRGDVQHMVRRISQACLFIVLVACPCEAANIQWVTVNDAGNAPDNTLPTKDSTSILPMTLSTNGTVTHGYSTLAPRGLVNRSG